MSPRRNIGPQPGQMPISHFLTTADSKPEDPPATATTVWSKPEGLDSSAALTREDNLPPPLTPGLLAGQKRKHSPDSAEDVKIQAPKRARKQKSGDDLPSNDVRPLARGEPPAWATVSSSIFASCTY